MSGRLAALTRKELSQQRWLLLALPLVLALLGLVFWRPLRDDPTATSRLGASARAVRTFVPLAALALGHNLVVREYQAHGQRFLESLPLRRWEPLLAKYAVGLGAIAGAVVLFCPAFALLESETELRFIGLMTARALGFAFPIWSMCFSFGLLGKLRVPCYITLGVGLTLLDRSGSFSILHFGPFELLDSATFVSERVQVPTRALLEALLASAASLGLGAVVGLARDGTLADHLSQRASAREVVAAGVVLFAELTSLGVTKSKTRVTSFRFVGEGVARSDVSGSQVLYGEPELEPSATQVALALGQLSERLKRELGADPAPPLHAVHNPLLEEREVKVRSQERGGVLLELNLGARELDLQALSALATHESLGWLSQGRAMYEPNHWLLDGFSEYWTADSLHIDRCWQRALVASAHVDLDARQVGHWLSLMDQAGEAGASAIGCSLVSFIADRHGPEPVLDVVRRLLARPTVTGLVSWWRERQTTPATLLEQFTHEPWAELVESWTRELAHRAERAPRLLADERLLRARLDVARSAIGGDVSYDIAGPAPAVERECRLLHHAQPPFDEYVITDRASQQRLVWAAGSPQLQGNARGLYPSGTRAWLAIECAVPGLGFRARLCSQRVEMP